MTEVRILRARDASVLERVADDVFDDAIVPAAAEEFLADPNHRIAVAIDDGVVIGMVTAVRYVHPDKARPELWINEVGVAPSHHRQGIGKRVMDAMLAEARALGCTEAWVLTSRTNEAAMALYTSAGGVDDGDNVMLTFHL